MMLLPGRASLPFPETASLLPGLRFANVVLWLP
jgi:hypothetical protein